MPDLKISELTQDTTPATTDEVALQRGGTSNFRCTLAEIGTAIGATGLAASLFDANTILAADTDDTPAAVTVAEQTLVGRITGGNIVALTVAQIRTLIGSVFSSAVVTDHAIPRGNGGTYEVQDSGVTIDDSDNIDTNGGWIAASVRAEDTASTAITLADSDNGKAYRTTNGSAITVTIGDSVSTGVCVAFTQGAGGQISFAVTGSVTVQKLSTKNAATAGQGATVLVIVHESAAALGTTLAGQLEDA